MGIKIYADHAATTRLSDAAFDAMKPWLCEYYGNPSSLYSMARKPRKAIYEARECIAMCIGAEPDEIYFTSGGTESNNWALKCFDYHHILTSSIEHHAILNVCHELEKHGRVIDIIPVTEFGVIDINHYKQVVPSVQFASVMMANNEIGTVQPIAELANIAHDHGVLFHTDAVQAIGHIPVDVRVLNIDMLSASAHKFNGPKGIGFIYIRRGLPIHSCMQGGGQESGMRSGTENVASIVAMSTALKENVERMTHTTAHLNQLTDCILYRLNAAGIDYQNNGANPRLPGILSLSFRGISGESILHQMDLYGISISTGSACNSHDPELSHVIRALSLPEEYAHGTIRISLGHENTEDEAECIAETLIQIIHNI